MLIRNQPEPRPRTDSDAANCTAATHPGSLTATGVTVGTSTSLIGVADEAAATRGRIVLLWDMARHRRAVVSGIIRDTGGNSHTVEADVPGDLIETSDCNRITLIAVRDASIEDDPAFEMIARYKRAGSLILCYGDGVNQWPVRCKCRPLLAGATHLLDSASAGFATDLRRVLEQTFQALAETCRHQQEVRSLMRKHGIVGDSAAITDAFRLAMRFSQFSDLPVLLTGESGTGKELVAKAISGMDPKRNEGPFVPINCAAIPPTLLENEFFGHRRGAFTGAERDRRGWIRAADGGVLFLDEIAELDIGLQSKLLRVLQENRVLGVGEEHEVAVNVRFIAASNQNLEQLAAERGFRADLFHRLRALLIHIPPLHERLSDVPLLVEHFVQEHHSTQSRGATAVSADFLDALRQLDLPGNVRQLKNLVRQSILNHQGPGELDLPDLPVDVLQQLTGPFEQSVAARPAEHGVAEALGEQMLEEAMSKSVKRLLESQGWNLLNALREYERKIFQLALQRTAGNQSQAARLLGITPRCVYNKVRKYHLPP